MINTINTMNLEKFTELLDSLAVKSYGINLAGGKIHWTDAAGTVVAHADVKAVISWAATNNSAMWAYAIGQFQDAEVPVVKPEILNSEQIGNILDVQAAEFAAKAAEAAGAEYLYRAANGANGLYLAVYNFKAESYELSPDEILRKRKSSIGYIIQMIGSISEILNNKRRVEEASKLLQHFSDALNQQIEFVLKGDDLKEEAAKLQKSIAAWVGMLPDQRKDVLAFMKQAASKWQRMI
jgi:hypothetical protein